MAFHQPIPEKKQTYKAPRYNHVQRCRCRRSFSAFYASRQLRDTRHQSELQNRAYMYVEDFAFHVNISPTTKSAESIFLAISLKNGGNTPAYHVVSKLYGRYLEFPLQNPIETYEKSMIQTDQTAATFAFKNQGVLQSATDPGWTDAGFEKLRLSESNRYYFWGEVTWNDIVRKPHWLHYCYYVGGVESFPQPVATPTLIKACPAYNDSDPEGEAS